MFSLFDIIVILWLWLNHLMCEYLFAAHSPDNSFMGFVVESHINDTAETRSIVRKNQALVYGKAEYMWQVSRSYSVWQGRVYVASE